MRIGTTAVMLCHGILVYGRTDLLYVPVSQLVPTHQRIVLDLSYLSHIDSRIYATTKTKGCSVELNLGKKIRELLIMINVLPAFTITGEHDIRM